MPSHRVLVVGLDGMSAEALEVLGRRGAVPTLWGLVQQGWWGTMTSTLPPCTCPAWPTMCTGLGPGRHGVFSFVRREEGGERRVATMADAPAPRLWQVAQAGGRRVAALYVPTMFPADAVRPLAVSGYPAPDRPGAGAVYPPEAEPALREALGGLAPVNPGLVAEPSDSEEDLAHAQARAIREKAEADCRRVLACFERAAREPLDLAVVVFSLPDHLFHPFYGCLTAPDGAPEGVLVVREAMDEAFARLDGVVARMLERFGWRVGPSGTTPAEGAATVLVVSDHGFTRKRGTLYLSEVLRRAGLLGVARLRALWQRLWRGRKERGIEGGLAEADIWENPTLRWDRTLVVPATEHEWGLFVNRRGLRPRGVVDEADYEGVRQRAIEALLAVRDPASGQPPVRAVHRREEVYTGPFVEAAPDLVLEMAPGWHYRTKISWRVARRRVPVVPATGPAGVHTTEAVLAAAGPRVRPNPRPAGITLADVAPTVLALLGIEPPGGLDGRMLGEVFDFPAERRPVPTEAAPAQAAAALGEAPAGSGYTAEDEAEVARRLEDLGYL